MLVAVAFRGDDDEDVQVIARPKRKVRIERLGDEGEMKELRQELDQLRQELKEMQKELKK